MSLTVSAPSLSRTSRWTAHRTSQAQTRRTLSSAPSPTVGAIGWTLRRPRVPFAPSARLPAGGARGCGAKLGMSRAPVSAPAGSVEGARVIAAKTASARRTSFAAAAAASRALPSRVSMFSSVVASRAAAKAWSTRPRRA